MIVALLCPFLQSWMTWLKLLLQIVAHYSGSVSDLWRFDQSAVRKVVRRTRVVRFPERVEHSWRI